jgi:hypothetical protein
MGKRGYAPGGALALILLVTLVPLVHRPGSEAQGFPKNAVRELTQVKLFPLIKGRGGGFSEAAD